MISRRFPRVSRLSIAVIAAILALALTGGALARALTVHDPAAATAPSIALPQATLASGGDDSPLVFDDDPFSAARTAPATRYTLAATRAPQRATSRNRETPAVLGTVVASDGSSFAISSVNGGSPKTVPVGGKIGDYVVEAVGRGHVIFRDAEGRQVAVRAANGEANRGMAGFPAGMDGWAQNAEGTGWTGPDGSVWTPTADGNGWTSAGGITSTIINSESVIVTPGPNGAPGVTVTAETIEAVPIQSPRD